MPKC